MFKRKINFYKNHAKKFRGYFLLSALFFCFIFFTATSAFSESTAQAGYVPPPPASNRYILDYHGKGNSDQNVYITTNLTPGNESLKVYQGKYFLNNNFAAKEVLPPLTECLSALHQDNSKKYSKDSKDPLARSTEVLSTKFYNIYKTSDSTDVAITYFDGPAGFLIHKQLNTNA